MIPEIRSPERTISKDAVRVKRISGMLEHLIVFIIIGVLLSLDAHFQWVRWVGWILMGLGLAAVLSAVWSIAFKPVLFQKYWRYDVDEEFIQLKHGVFVVSHVLVPMTKVQSVELKQGPLQRRYNLYSIHVSTMGSTHSIPLIPEQEAHALRDQIARFAKIKEVET